jgi:hypothetical protein
MQWVYFFKKPISFEITGKISTTNEDSGQRKYGQNMPTTCPISQIPRISMQYALLFNALMKGIKLHLRNDTDLNRTRNRLSNIPLRPPRPIRLQLLRNPSSHGYSNLSSRLSQPPRFPTKHQNASRRNGIGNPLPNKTNSHSY